MDEVFMYAAITIIWVYTIIKWLQGRKIVYEYKYLIIAQNFSQDLFLEVINNHGKDGWELVGSAGKYKEKHLLLFKRQSYEKTSKLLGF